jgi:predicted SnoaL-like aldol condensation-catalyzing enzyme
MKSLLLFFQRFLERHPRLRRKIVNTIYRMPVLDMRLRATLDKRGDMAWQRVDVQDLPAEVQEVYDRLHQGTKPR